jgi:phytoene dehydrogenase-like protein
MVSEQIQSLTESSLSNPPPMPDKLDVVIIGAGIAGLTAAAVLAKSGLKVALYESEPQAGGCLVAFRRGDFTFDTSIQWLNQFRPGGFTYRIHHYLGDDGPEFPKLNRIHRYKGTRRDYILTSNPFEFRDQLLQDFPSEATGINALFREAEKFGTHLLYLDDRMRAACTMTFREKCSHALGMMRWVWPIRHFATTSAQKGLRRYFTSPELLDLFHSNDSLMSVMVPLGFAFTGDFQALPKGGGKTIVDWLCASIEKSGGKVYLNAPVREVLVDEKKIARGIKLETGVDVPATYVIGACDSTLLFSKMVPGGACFDRWQSRMTKADLYHSSFSIYLGLDCPASQLGLGEELVHLTEDSVPPPERIKGHPETTTISVLSPSFRDPSLAPAGKGTLQIQCPAYLSYQDYWKTEKDFGRGEAYRQLKKQYADVLLERVERNLIPELRRHIEEISIATPVTFLRYTANRAGGIMGLRPTPQNIRAGLAQLTTPVQNLLLGSQWASYGGGVPIATKTAVNAALIILRQMRPESFQVLKDVVDGTVKARA